ncbi:MAG: aminoacyl--tRNA ligase-related protein, partial [Planctomycetia bacterium]
ARDLLMREGFTAMTPPDLARDTIREGTGFMPRGNETQIDSIKDSDLSLDATPEITLGGAFHERIFEADELPLKLCGISHCFRTEAGAHGKATRGLYRVHQFTKVEMFAFTLPEGSEAMHERIFEADELPLKLCGISHCFRTEAGAHGRATRGLYRVHQFTKVEMFAYTLPEQSEDMHNYLLDLECELFDGLGIPYRVIDTASGDLGGPAYRKFDLEAWMPGRGERGEWGEVTSTSNCTDYQARRLAVRYRKPGEKGTSYVHTLNGTAIAISRAIIAIMENYQCSDGSIVIPDALVPWMGKKKIEPS